MKHYALVLVALIILSGASIWLVASRPTASGSLPRPAGETASRKAASAASARLEAASVTTPLEDEAAPAPPANSASAADAIVPLVTDPQEAKALIRGLASTFDPAETATLLRYLEHPHAEVRLEAASGLVMLGDAAAVHALRLAAEKADARQASPEGATLREAAEILASAQAGGPRISPTPAIERTIQGKPWRPAAP